MVKRGWSANDAIDKIYQAYGPRTSVTTKIIKKLQDNKKTHYRQFIWGSFLDISKKDLYIFSIFIIIYLLS